jgi:long-chain acyl-CoA synthetase
MITRSIFDWAERTPDKTALVYNGHPWSYRAFADFIALARGYLDRQGCAGPGVAVVAAVNLLDFWILSLALRSLGLTTVVVPTVEAIGGLGLPDVRCVVTPAAESWPGLAELCASRGFRLVSFSPIGQAPLGLDAGPQPERSGGHILLTSGTTGMSKKVLIDPSFESQSLRARREITGITQDSVISVFDFAGWTAAGFKVPACAWEVGATVVADQRPQRHMGLLYPGVTEAMLVPTMLASLLAEPEGAFPRNESLHLTVGAGTITQTQIDQAKARVTPHLFSRLSATEVGMFGYTALETPDDHRWHRLVPGREVQIVDEFDRPLPADQLGLVRVSTAGEATGYLHDDEATRTFFRDGFFYTGDLAARRADGRIALQGRVTGVINIGGGKLSPEPIEDGLREALGLSGACLFSLQDDAGEEQLHLVVEGTAPVDEARLVTYLRGALPTLPPTHIHTVATLPRNTTGKLMREAVRTQVLASVSQRTP